MWPRHAQFLGQVPNYRTCSLPPCSPLLAAAWKNEASERKGEEDPRNQITLPYTVDAGVRGGEERTECAVMRPPDER